MGCRWSRPAHGAGLRCASASSAADSSADDSTALTLPRRKGWVGRYRKLERIAVGRCSSAKIRLCESVDGGRYALKIYHKRTLRRQRFWDVTAERYVDMFELLCR